MLEKQSKITANELKTYLYSLNAEKKNAKEEAINNYKIKCEKTRKKIKLKEIQKINIAITKAYKERIQARDIILKLLEECADTPKMMEKLAIAKYMVYRANARSAESILIKAERGIGRRYNDLVEKIENKLDAFPALDHIEEIDFSEYKTDHRKLEIIKEQYKEDYTEEERKALIQRDLDMIARAQVFNTTPIPHEILKDSDRDIQSKMPRFNNIRQKRLRILSTMKDDYVKLEIPREINAMIDDAILNIENIKDILTKSEYNKIKNILIRKRKKIFRNTSEIRNIIKIKERKAGIINYNIQEARYARMETLRNIINESNMIIRENLLPGAEEQLKKLKASYEREKQYAAVIEKLEEESGNNITQNMELRAFEEQIRTLEYKINTSEKIIGEEQLKIERAKKELIILWKMEIDTTISKKKEYLEIGAPAEKTKSKIQRSREKQKRAKGLFVKLKKSQGGKHACV